MVSIPTKLRYFALYTLNLSFGDSKTFLWCKCIVFSLQTKKKKKIVGDRDKMGRRVEGTESTDPHCVLMIVSNLLNINIKAK